MNGWQIKRRIDETAIFLCGKFVQHIEDQAKSGGLPANELGKRVAGLLYSQTGGEVLGTEDRLPALRGAATRNGDALAEVAVARRPRGQAQVAPKREYRAGAHWTQLPENRDRVEKKMRRLNKARRSTASKARVKKLKSMVEAERFRKYSKGMRNYWSKMTPAQRSKEIIRRRELARKNIVQAALNASKEKE
jgi:hypothetical protein